MNWQYQTVLFEFSKNGLLSDRYMDDEEIEKTLNSLGREGWELVSVSLLEDGLLAILKQPIQAQEAPVILQQNIDQPEPVVQMEPTLPQPAGRGQERLRYQEESEQPLERTPKPVLRRQPEIDDGFGGIRIS